MAMGVEHGRERADPFGAVLAEANVSAGCLKRKTRPAVRLAPHG
jgi:hypothetical protein